MKSVILYKITGDVNEFLATITNEALEAFAYTPCGEFQKESLGFSHTFDNEYVTDATGKVIINISFSDKKVNGAECKRRVKKLADEFEKEFGRKPSKETLVEYKDAVTNQLLPATFESEKKDFTIFIQDDILYVEASSFKKADSYVELLTSTLGALPIEPLEVAKDVATDLVRMVSEELSATISLSEKVVLETKDGKWTGATQLYHGIAQQLITEGAIVKSVELIYKNTLKFNIKEDMLITGMNFAKGLFGELKPEDIAATKLLQFDETTKMVSHLLAEFGGIKELGTE